MRLWCLKPKVGPPNIYHSFLYTVDIAPSVVVILAVSQLYRTLCRFHMHGIQLLLTLLSTTIAPLNRLRSNIV